MDHTNIDYINKELSEIKEILSKLLSEKQELLQGEDDFIGLKEACKITKLSASTIYNLKLNDKIPYHKRTGSNKLMFSRKELESWRKTGNQNLDTESKFIKNKRGKIIIPLHK